MDSKRKYTYRFADAEHKTVIASRYGWPKMLYRAQPSRDGFGWWLTPAEDLAGCEPRIKYRPTYVDASLVEPFEPNTSKNKSTADAKPIAPRPVASAAEQIKMY